MSTDPEAGTAFDSYAKNYDAALEQGIAVSGENKEYFARERVAWLALLLDKIGFRPQSALDFGCGTGSGAMQLLEQFPATRIVGVDISKGLLEVARREHGSAGIGFVPLQEHSAAGEFDLAYCNGVFHHIPLAERGSAVKHVLRSLKPGGIFAFWENNPWNPGTRYVMSRIPFDRDAVMLSPPQARAMLSREGFKLLGTSYRFVFPRALKWLRPLEPALSSLPLGAQYQILARKPAADPV